jgi:hypothetical protein
LVVHALGIRTPVGAMGGMVDVCRQCHVHSSEHMPVHRKGFPVFVTGNTVGCRCMPIRR